MATPWPQGADWPLELREHATELTKYLRDTLNCIDRSQDQAVPASLVRTMITGTLTMISKTLRTPDLTTIQDTLRIMQTEADETARESAKVMEIVRMELRSNAADIKRNITIGEKTRAAAEEASERGKQIVEVVKELKDKAPPVGIHGQMSYAAAAASGMLPSGTQSIQRVKAVSLQAQREIIVSIRNPLTISKLRAMNPRNLMSHVQRALEQSQNEHITHVKIMSFNQLKSGDLSLRTATASETQALRQFADDWVTRVGNGAYVRNPTYGVLAHGIRTSTMEMDKFEEIRGNILQDNRPFIPRAEIKYVGWLTRNATSKSASSVIIEFTKPEDANKIIDEGLVWQSELFQCERYERQCRLKQCFKCQKYGHIGTQCKAITACGYCAQEHSSRDCPSKAERTATRKCAACGGAHEAWNQGCPTRKDELARTKAAYATRSQYHPVPEASGPTTQPGPMAGTLRRRRTARDMVQPSEAMVARDSSPPGRGRKRANTGLPLPMPDKENGPPSGVRHQRPQRAANPSRRALEALENNTLIRTTSQHMEIDSDSYGPMNSQTTLKILQYNVRKFRDTVMATLLRDPKVMEYDVLAIQEPWRNPFMSTTHHPAKAHFHLCYPAAIEGGPARVCFFINKRLDNTTWQFKSDTGDACSLRIQYEKDDQAQGCIHIHNIYNPGQTTEGRESVLPLILTLLETHQLDDQIVLGDFNLHLRSIHRQRKGLEPAEPYHMETVRHILLICRRLKDIRRQQLGHLPEGNDLRAILSKREVATKAINFMEHVQILGQSRVAEE